MADSDIERGKRIMGGYKHDGSKGPKYTRWKERFLDDAQGAGDADYSMAQCLLWARTAPKAVSAPQRLRPVLNAVALRSLNS